MTRKQIDARLREIQKIIVRFREELAEDEPTIEKAVCLGAVAATEQIFAALLRE